MSIYSLFFTNFVKTTHENINIPSFESTLQFLTRHDCVEHNQFEVVTAEEFLDVELEIHVLFDVIVDL